MDARFSPQDEVFRSEIARWLDQNLRGEFEVVKGRGGPGDEHALFEERHAWERLMGRAGWIGVGWPKSVGGRGLPLSQQMIFHEEYARSGGPGRVGHIGEGLLGPTVIHFGSADQKERFLPKILSGDEVWCQGYSEPGAGSDLVNVQTRAELQGDEWILDLVPGTLNYAGTIEAGPQKLQFSATRVVKAEGNSWVITDTAKMPMGEAVHTSTVEKGTLVPQKCVVRQGPVTIDVAFGGGKATGTMEMGAVIAGPLYDREDILYAELDRNEIARGRFDLDVTGHYARPDVFQLTVNEKPTPSVIFTIEA